MPDSYFSSVKKSSKEKKKKNYELPTIVGETMNEDEKWEILWIEQIKSKLVAKNLRSFLDLLASRHCQVTIG